MADIWGAIEAGGTKFVCAVGTGPHDLRDEVRFPTTTPSETLSRALEYFQDAQKKHGKLRAVGIGSFGPVDLHPASKTWGSITATPKPHWSETPVAAVFRNGLGVPVGFDTDVNGAVLGEHLWGAGKGLDNLIYITVGTGFGGGAMVGGQLVHGLVHPEMGHFLLPPDPEFAGVCPFHGHCVEGMVSGPALEKRWGKKGFELGDDHPAWDIEAHQLAITLQTILLCFSPQKILMGGGVMDQTLLFPKIRTHLLELNHGYVRHPLLTPEHIDEYVTPPGLGNRAGILGALALAQRAG